MPGGTDIMTHSGLVLQPDPARTVLRPFDLADPNGFDQQPRDRPRRIADRVLEMDDATFEQEFARVRRSLGERHRDMEGAMARRFEEIAVDAERIGRERSLLIGAYFLEEYAYEAAALFNPSMVRHDDQTGLPDGGVRFVLSMRSVGEGHISSTTFRVGTWSAAAGFAVEQPGKIATALRVEHADDDGKAVRIICDGGRDVSESVLFPVTPAQAQGIEDLRMVRFADDDGTERRLGTYTASSAAAARTEMMESFGYDTAELRAMTGAVADTKGMALFPRKIGGRYMMLSRQDSENIWLVGSDSLTHWEGGDVIIRPRFFWEYAQMGNCGPPIEIDEGWLVLTHGVGSVRNYCIGAVLLDRDDPTRILGRRTLPLVHPSPKERDGYVPNVVYSCGGMVHDRTLLLPYSVADSFTTFAHVALDELLATLA